MKVFALVRCYVVHYAGVKLLLTSAATTIYYMTIYIWILLPIEYFPALLILQPEAFICFFYSIFRWRHLPIFLNLVKRFIPYFLTSKGLVKLWTFTLHDVCEEVNSNCTTANTASHFAGTSFALLVAIYEISDQFRTDIMLYIVLTLEYWIQKASYLCE